MGDLEIETCNKRIAYETSELSIMCGSPKISFSMILSAENEHVQKLRILHIFFSSGIKANLGWHFATGMRSKVLSPSAGHILLP